MKKFSISIVLMLILSLFLSVGSANVNKDISPDSVSQSCDVDHQGYFNDFIDSKIITFIYQVSNFIEADIKCFNCLNIAMAVGGEKTGYSTIKYLNHDVGWQITQNYNFRKEPGKKNSLIL